MIGLIAKKVVFTPGSDLVAPHKPRSIEKQLEHNLIGHVWLCKTLDKSLNFSKFQCPHLKNDDILRVVYL